MSYKRTSPMPVVEGGTGLIATGIREIITGGTATTGPLISSIPTVDSVGTITTQNSVTGSNLMVLAYNTDNTSPTSHAILEARCGGSFGGDAKVIFTVSAIRSWAIGSDNSDSRAFVFSNNYNLGSVNRLKLTEGGELSLPSGNLTISSNASGTDRYILLQNLGNAAGTTATMFINCDTSVGDPQVNYSVNSGGTLWTHGIDNSDSDSFVLCKSGALGTTNVLRASTAGAVSFLLGNVDITREAIASTVSLLVSNTDNTDVASHALIQARSGGSSGGDALITLTVTGSTNWSIGCDNSNSDVLSFSNNAALGTAERMQLTTSGFLTLSNNNSGVDKFILLENTGNAAGTLSTMRLSCTTTVGDPQVQYLVNAGGQTWTHGIDNSDSDAFVIAASSDLGTTNTIRIGNTGGVSLPNGNLTISRASAGATVGQTIANTSNTASSDCLVSLTVGGSSAGDAFHTYTTSGVNSWATGLDNSDSDSFVIAASTALGTTNVVRASTSGWLNYPLQPAFLAYLATSVTNVTGDATDYTVIFDTEVFDQGTNFNLGTSTFTAPVTGRYRLEFAARLTGGTAITACTCSIVTSNRTYRNIMHYTPGATTEVSGVVSVLADMDVNDTATFHIQSTDSGGKIDDISGTVSSALVTYCSGSLVC